MTTDVLDDLDWALELTSNIPCDFLLRDPMRPCPNLGVHRVKVDCRDCKKNKGILWACKEHFEWLKEGNLGCGKCGGGQGMIRWELL